MFCYYQSSIFFVQEVYEAVACLAREEYSLLVGGNFIVSVTVASLFCYYHGVR